MDWVSGIGRGSDGRICLQVQDAEGVHALRSLSDLDTKLKAKGTVRRKIGFQLEATARIDVDEYLRGVGLEHLDGKGQVAYAVTTEAGRVVIPSQLMMMATVGAHGPCRALLLEPTEPSSLMQVHAGRGTGLRIEASSEVYNQAPLVERLTWLLTYPSAHAAWGSVYRNALEGRFDMRLPKASVTASAHGLLAGDTLFVTELHLLELRPLEDPLPFAARYAPSSFVFNNTVGIRNTHGKAAAPAADVSIGTNGTVAPLTDEQWAAVEQVLKASEPKAPGRPRAHPLRDIVECIRLKLGTPYSWSKCPGDKALKQSASVLLSKLQREGTWGRVLAAMAAPAAS
jgi:hypothetical protein